MREPEATFKAARGIPLAGRGLLGLDGKSRSEIVEYLRAADALLWAGRAARESADGRRRLPSLAGRTVVNLFLEPSTRTRISFELAAKRLGAECVNFTAATSSTTKGETLDDTARNIDAMGADVVVIRTGQAGGPLAVQRRIRAHVINAGDGAHEHPTQGLLDASTICAHRRALGVGQANDPYDLGGVRVAIVGDIRHSRVARSDLYVLNTLGASVVVSGPRTMIPPGIAELGCQVAPTLAAALEGAHVVIMLRIQLERGAGGALPSLREYARSFGLNKENLRLAAPDALVMHPGPINRGVELHPEVADGPQSVILEQVERGVAVRMAVLCRLLGAEIPGGAA